MAIEWCTYGRIIAANLLQVPLEQIPRTNNHLESFNSKLKIHQLQKYQNKGNLLRLDLLSVILIKSITPNILLKRDLKYELQNNLKKGMNHTLHFYHKKEFNLKIIIINYHIIYQMLIEIKLLKEFVKKGK